MLAEKSLEIKREYNDQIGILPLLINMSILYNKEKNYDASSRALDEVLSIAKREGDLFHQAEAMIKKAGLYRRTGKVEQAYDLLLDYINLREEILGEKTQKAVEVKKGTLVLLHGRLPHYSCENTSKKSRHAYTLHVIDGDKIYPKENWLQRPNIQMKGFI